MEQLNGYVAKTYGSWIINYHRSVHPEIDMLEIYKHCINLSQLGEEGLEIGKEFIEAIHEKYGYDCNFIKNVYTVATMGMHKSIYLTFSFDIRETMKEMGYEQAEAEAEILGAITSLPTLKVHEREIWAKYDEQYARLNEYLRGEREYCSEDEQSIIENFQQLIRSKSRPQNVQQLQLYRGISIDPKWQLNEIVTFDGFTSLSMFPAFAKTFMVDLKNVKWSYEPVIVAPCAFLILKIPTTAPLLWIKLIAFLDENYIKTIGGVNEIILAPAAKFIVTHIKHIGVIAEYILEYVVKMN